MLNGIPREKDSQRYGVSIYVQAFNAVNENRFKKVLTGNGGRRTMALFITAKLSRSMQRKVEKKEVIDGRFNHRDTAGVRDT